MNFTVGIVGMPSHNSYGGISRVITNLAAEWEKAGTRLVPLKVHKGTIPVIRNLRYSVGPVNGVDVVLFPQLTGALALRHLTKPSIVIVHDIGIIDCELDRRDINWLTYRIILKNLWSLRLSSAIVTDSQFTATRLLKYMPDLESKVSVITPGLALPLLDSAFGSDTRDLTNNPKILYVGTEISRKNIRELLVMLYHLKRFYPSVVLSKVGHAGSSQARANTLSLMKEFELIPNQDVIFYDMVDDTQLIHLYKQSDVFVSLSLYEGFGFPALEAMSQHCPVVLSKRGSFPEYFGQYAWVVEPNGKAAAAVVRNILSTPTLKIQPILDRARIAATKFSWNRAASEYSTLMQRVVNVHANS